MLPFAAIIIFGKDCGKLKGFALTTSTKGIATSKETINATKMALIITKNKLQLTKLNSFIIKKL